MIYLYECEKCNYTEDVFRGVEEVKVVKCPSCNKAMKQVITGGCGTHFNGDGWTRKLCQESSKVGHWKIKELHGPSFLKKCLKK
jgi:putative FmdB family regulatory protein